MISTRLCVFLNWCKLCSSWRHMGGGVGVNVTVYGWKYTLQVIVRLLHRVHTEWQRPLSGVHFIMMEKLAQAGKGVGARPPPFHYICPHVQSCSGRSSWEGSYTHTLFHLYPYVRYSVGYMITNLAWVMYLARWGQTFSDQQDSRQTAGSWFVISVG